MLVGKRSTARSAKGTTHRWRRAIFSGIPLKELKLCSRECSPGDNGRGGDTPTCLAVANHAVCRLTSNPVPNCSANASSFSAGHRHVPPPLRRMANEADRRRTARKRRRRSIRGDRPVRLTFDSSAATKYYDLGCVAVDDAPRSRRHTSRGARQRSAFDARLEQIIASGIAAQIVRVLWRLPLLDTSAAPLFPRS